MTTTATSVTASSANTASSRTRLFAVACAALAAVAVWVIAVPMLGANLAIRFGQGAEQVVQLGFVVAGSLVASLVGWALLVLLERRNRRGAAIWTILAVAFLLVSLVFPVIAGTTATTALTLILMHIAVGAVLIPWLRRTSTR